MNRPVEAIQSLLAGQGLLSSKASLLCAVSGGVDSTALLFGLAWLREQYGFSLRALHVQHGLRGAASLEDEAFVRQCCERLRVPLTVRNAGLTGDMDTPGIETLARNARLRLFREEVFREDALLLAHHRDDQAETVLMHLLRGAGSDGLGGMPFSGSLEGKPLLRPFLQLSKGELATWLADRGIGHREDGSNAEPGSPRNRIRLQLMPLLEELYPGAAGRISENAEILRTESAYLEEESGRIFHASFVNEPPLYALKLSGLRGQPRALLRRVIRRWVREAFPLIGYTDGEMGLSYADTLSLCDMVLSGIRGETNLPHNLKACKGRFLLNLEMQGGTPLLSIPEGQPSGSPHGDFERLGTHFTLRFSRAESIPTSPLFAVLPEAYRAAVFRLPAQGDLFHPLGAPGSKPLRRYFTDIYLDGCLRSCWPVLALEKEILWVPGLAVSQKLRLADSLPHALLMNAAEGLIPELITLEGDVHHGKRTPTVP